MKHHVKARSAIACLSIGVLASGCATSSTTQSVEPFATPSAIMSAPLARASSSATAEPAADPSPRTNDGGLELGDGELMVVVADEPLVLRTAPGIGDDSVILPVRLHPGMRARTIGEPSEADGYVWYRLHVGDLDGWAAVGSREGDPWLAPVLNGRIAFIPPTTLDGSAPAPRPQVWSVAPSGEDAEQLTQLPPYPADATRSRVVLAAMVESGDRSDGKRGSPVCFPGAIPVGWSGDGSLLLVVDGACVTYSPTIVAVNAADGSTTVIAEMADFPEWSVDGSRVAFAHADEWLQCMRTSCGGPEPEPRPAHELRVREADGSAREVTSHADWYVAREPSWSPDGRHLAYSAFEVERGGPRIWTASLADGEQRSLVDGTEPAWSPDGAWIVFTSPLSSDPQEVRVIELATGEVVRVGAGWSPRWSPDGSLIAYLGEGGVHVVELDGSGELVVSGGAFDWAPDGSSLVIETSGGDGPMLVVVKLDGSAHTELIRGYKPMWQPLIGD